MRLVDANVFISAIVEPADDLERRKAEACQALFRRVGTGEEQVQTHDVIIAEVAYFLTRSRLFQLTSGDAVDRMRPLVALTNLRLPNKRIVLDAFSVWRAHPKLDFEDALTAALAFDHDEGVYSYDHDFDRIPGIERVEPL